MSRNVGTGSGCSSPSPRVIFYRGGGISATIDAFARLLDGKEEVAVYLGSMAEWAGDESLPMETGS